MQCIKDLQMLTYMASQKGHYSLWQRVALGSNALLIQPIIIKWKQRVAFFKATRCILKATPKGSLLVVTTRCFGKQRVAYSANHNKVKTTRCFLKQRVAFKPRSNALLRHVRSEMLSPGGGADKYEVDTGVRPALQQAGAFGESTGSKNEGSLG